MGEPGTVLPVCERLLHMVNTHAIKDCAAMQEAADTIAALYEALENILEWAFDGPAYDAAVAALKQARGEDA